MCYGIKKQKDGVTDSDHHQKLIENKHSDLKKKNFAQYQDSAATGILFRSYQSKYIEWSWNVYRDGKLKVK